ncbi:hypothetical protein P170DRAFT_458585 [Aspergillus steynii IBT 23096]|uniref:Uncharacterized protein n=1 Tax=Aspergillus steynii IBT 23096 TaxID=1392250 RepID=A0A2I2FWF8_9EURO|nr:uncharacterized protein P170DRAFT_458585 [Aspergillus steynii IBT 23096]PLB44979.1 hypothetical protein P170DRAFT_458585 [Aspergillus steynii IBT 23096]
MKTPTILTLLPSLAHALVGLDWTVTGAPSTGLRDITFPISIAHAPHETGFYFAQQYGFHGLSDIGYTGLQPRPDNSGASIIHAVFSSFVPGSTSSDENCSDGADGGEGVSCSVEIAASYERVYHLVVENKDGTTTWTGTLVDVQGGNSTRIGEYTLPEGAGGIKDSQVGFVEYYPWNGQPSHTCDSLPATNASFGDPSSSAEGVKGSVGKPYEYGDCVGKAGFEVEETDDGYEVSVGF